MIETAPDVKRVVDAFYAKVNCDELLARFSTRPG
jgi:truncated hemoglobin YjbI